MGKGGMGEGKRVLGETAGPEGHASHGQARHLVQWKLPGIYEGDFG